MKNKNSKKSNTLALETPLTVDIDTGIEKDIDVLGLIKWDWANSGFRYTQALRKLGLNARSFKGTPLAYFNYPKQLPTLDILSKDPIAMFPITNDIDGNKEIQNLIYRAKVVYLFGTQLIANFNYTDETEFVVQHGGKTYRDAPELCNKIFNPWVKSTIAQCPDLLNLGAKNEHLIYYPVDTDLLQPDFILKDPKKIIIGHFPSSPHNKGTETITKVIANLKKTALGDKFEYNGISWDPENQRKHFVDWKDNLERLKSCDILIETCKPKLGEAVFGEWGNTAIEASALGTIVVTNSLSSDVYRQEYGDNALHINDGTAEGLTKTLKKLLHCSSEQILDKKKIARRWVIKNHSIEATALRLWEKVFKELFPSSEMQDAAALKKHAKETWSKEFLEVKGWL